MGLTFKQSEVWDNRTWFHLHTTFGDGSLSVADYFKLAKKAKIRRLVFLEHIRSYPSYGVQEYVQEIKENQTKTGIIGVVGFESKLNRDGTLDISPEALEVAEVVGLALHRFPNDINLYLRAMSQGLQQIPDKKRVWVHPGMWFARRDMMLPYFMVYKKLLDCAVEEGWLIEHNLKYDLIPYKFRKLVPSNRLIEGIDSHRLEDICTL